MGSKLGHTTLIITVACSHIDNMTKEKRKAILADCMTVSKRNDDTEYTHFTDKCPEELKDIFLEYYNVKDQDYEIFSKACDEMYAIYEEANQEDEKDFFIDEMITERVTDMASVYTWDRLTIITPDNQYEISDMVRDYNCDISDACGEWYDQAVQGACRVINDFFVNKKSK